LRQVTAAEIAAWLGEPQCAEPLALEWEQSQNALPRGALTFLDPAPLARTLRYGGYAEDQIEQAIRMARRINADDRLRMLAWHTHWRLFISKDDHWFRGWPRLEKRLGEDAGLFFLTIAADTIPRTRAFHQRLGIEEEVTHLTCMELRSFSANYAESSGGRLGVPLGQMIWLRHYTQENYFRLGRYEFWLRKHSDAEVILRHRANRKVVALAPAGWRFDAHGDRPHETEPVQPGEWVSALEETDAYWRGNPLDPRGWGLREIARFDKQNWELALREGDWVLDMHIPAGGGMTPEAVHASFHQAAVFFPRHFPATPPKGMRCWSWIYNPYLGDILPAESNLVRNLGNAYIVPVDAEPEEGLNFMFYQEKFDPATAPRKTSLQRAILAYLERGGRWRAAGMFYLNEELPLLGQQPYRRMWQPRPPWEG